MKSSKAFIISKIGVIALGVMASGANAQEEYAVEEVVVTGYRGSLQNSTAAKRDSDLIGCKPSCIRLVWLNNRTSLFLNMF